MDSPLRVAKLALVTCLLALALPVAAHAADLDEVTLYSDAGDYIGQGQPHLFTTANDTIEASSANSRVTVSITAGGVGPEYTLQFAGPNLDDLAVGTYEDAVVDP